MRNVPLTARRYCECTNDVPRRVAERVERAGASRRARCRRSTHGRSIAASRGRRPRASSEAGDRAGAGRRRRTLPFTDVDVVGEKRLKLRCERRDPRVDQRPAPGRSRAERTAGPVSTCVVPYRRSSAAAKCVAVLNAAHATALCCADAIAQRSSGSSASAWHVVSRPAAACPPLAKRRDERGVLRRTRYASLQRRIRSNVGAQAAVVGLSCAHSVVRVSTSGTTTPSVRRLVRPYSMISGAVTIARVRRRGHVARPSAESSRSPDAVANRRLDRREARHLSRRRANRSASVDADVRGDPPSPRNSS